MEVDIEGLAVALGVEAHAQLQMDERRWKNRERLAYRHFWRAILGPTWAEVRKRERAKAG